MKLAGYLMRNSGMTLLITNKNNAKFRPAEVNSGSDLDTRSFMTCPIYIHNVHYMDEFSRQ